MSAGPLKKRIVHAFEWRARHHVLRLIARHVDQTSSEHFQSFERARQLRATFDSMEYADVNMRSAVVYLEKRDVLAHGLRQVGSEGLYLELGVWSGRTINFIADHYSGTVHGFDSFEGLPENWAMQYRSGHFATGGKLPTVRSNVQLHVGWFDQTLPDFVRQHAGPIAFMHVDCDLYSSTKTAFQALGERIVGQTVIVFDEYFNYPGWREHEYKAFQEFVADKELRYRYLAYNERSHNVAVVID
jgi:hypothetical protein